MAKEYDIQKPGGRCNECEAQLAPGGEFVATVVEDGEAFRRQDYCLGCWGAKPRDESAMFGVWRSHVPQPQQKRKLLVDNEVIVGFFERLAGTDEPSKINFRYVLALVLMRKKLLVYERARKTEGGGEVWLVHFRGDERIIEVVDPHMDEEKIAEVSQQLNQIMEIDA